MTTLTLSLLLALLSVASLLTGAADLSPEALIAGDAGALTVLLASRLPRLLAAVLAGAGMSIAGLIMQQLCANKFVSPTTGATIASAQLGILLAFVFLPGSSLPLRTLVAFAAAMAGTAAFMAFALRTRLRDPIMVPLIGIMFSSVIGGVTSLLAFSFDMTQALSTWLVGHFSLIVRGDYEMVYLVLPLIALAWAYARHFNIVGMGRAFSKNLGVNYTAVLAAGLAVSSAMTAAVVSVAGTVPFVGLIVPNIVSIFKGDDLRSTIADTALGGAVFVLGCDLIARLVIAPYELPIELVTGVIGSIVFIALILRRLRGGGRKAPARTSRALQRRTAS